MKMYMHTQFDCTPKCTLYTMSLRWRDVEEEGKLNDRMEVTMSSKSALVFHLLM